MTYIRLCEVTYIRLLLRVGIKVVDECQISLEYVALISTYVDIWTDVPGL